jgi:hypothetical protein
MLIPNGPTLSERNQVAVSAEGDPRRAFVVGLGVDFTKP